MDTLAMKRWIFDGVAYAMVERIAGVGEMGYFGSATGTIDNGRITATFDGQYRLGYGPSGTVLCQAPDHLIDVTPRVDDTLFPTLGEASGQSSFIFRTSAT